MILNLIKFWENALKRISQKSLKNRDSNEI